MAKKQVTYQLPEQLPLIIKTLAEKEGVPTQVMAGILLVIGIKNYRKGVDHDDNSGENGTSQQLSDV